MFQLVTILDITELTEFDGRYVLSNGIGDSGIGATNQFKKDRQNASDKKNPEHLVQLQVLLNLQSFTGNTGY